MSDIYSTIIRIQGNEVSEKAANWCWQSAPANLEPKYFDAVVPDAVDGLMSNYNIEWNYPWEGEIIDIKSGLKKRGYKTIDPLKRMACFLSHYICWTRVIRDNKPYMILEHDAVFKSKKPMPIKEILESPYDIVGINDPRGATRFSAWYHELIQRQIGKQIMRAPQIDTPDVPQGLAGNSAYIIKPAGAQHMLNLVKEYGAWPNDAIMCRQLVPKLGVTTKYYTTVQNTRSTTTL